MTKTLLTSLLLAGSALTTQAQTLFTYGGQSVTKADFLRVYQKNGSQKKADLSEKALRDYLDLYSLFRMKVAEAEAQKLDTAVSLQREMESYRRQLSRTYISDPSTTEKLITEAYDRRKTVVEVAHILISLPAATRDTAAAWQKADSLYNEANKKGADFGALAAKYSADNGSKARNGVVGYITALQTVYPFENVAYNTPVGKISKPFRTQFGYHILKVLNRKPAQGEVEVSQIMAVTLKSKGDEGAAAARRTIDSARKDLAAGMSWNDAVKKYSQDRYSKDNNGLLKPFGVGRTVPAFEDAAFALKAPGDLSQPVQTEYGIHLLKLEKKIPMKPFDSVRDELRRKVENDARGQIAKDNYTAGVKARYHYQEIGENLDSVIARVTRAIPDTGKKAGRFRAADYANDQTALILINKKVYTAADFMRFAAESANNYLSGNKEAGLRELFQMYSASVLNDFQIQSLEKENTEFRGLLTEYRDGILLFDLMDRNVWSKASKDSVGLAVFYEMRKDKYKWEEGFEGTVYRFKDRKTAEDAMAMMQSSMDTTKERLLLEKFNTPATPGAVTAQRGKFEWSRFTDFSKGQLTAGKPSAIKTNADNTFDVVYVKRFVNAGEPKTLAEARGYVVAEYQDYLEKTWNESLRKKYPLVVNESAFRAMVAK